MQFYNYRFASEILESTQFKAMKQDVMDILTNATVPQLRQAKARTRDGKTYKFTTDQKAFNQYFKEEFERRGWEVNPLITDDGVTKIKADFKKDRVQIEIQFGNMARWYTDVFKAQVSYSVGLIDVAILIVATQTFAGTIDENVAYFERVTRELPYAKMSITLPILVIGIEP